MIVGCDAVENYMFFRDSQLARVVGSSQELHVLLYSLQMQDRTTGYLQHNAMTNSEM